MNDLKDDYVAGGNLPAVEVNEITTKVNNQYHGKSLVGISTAINNFYTDNFLKSILISSTTFTIFDAENKIWASRNVTNEKPTASLINNFIINGSYIYVLIDSTELWRYEIADLTNNVQMTGITFNSSSNISFDGTDFFTYNNTGTFNEIQQVSFSGTTLTLDDTITLATADTNDLDLQDISIDEDYIYTKANSTNGFLFKKWDKSSGALIKTGLGNVNLRLWNIENEVYFHYAVSGQYFLYKVPI